MLWSILGLYSRGVCAWFGAGFEDNIGEGNSDYPNDGKDEEGEKLTLDALLAPACTSARKYSDLPAHRTSSPYSSFHSIWSSRPVQYFFTTFRTFVRRPREAFA